MKKGETIFTMGNDAMTAGAIAAGARFYAGYPITPSSEVAELSSVRLPQVGGLYVQMEDELGSMAAIIGASAAGKKSYTATSGPGFSLMHPATRSRSSPPAAWPPGTAAPPAAAPAAPWPILPFILHVLFWKLMVNLAPFSTALIANKR